MKRSRPAKRDHYGVAWINAAIDRYGPDGERHRSVRDRCDAKRGRRRVKAELSAELGQRRLGAGAIELHAAAKKAIAVKAAQRKVRIGHGWPFAAASVAYRSRVRAGRDRSHMQTATIVNPGDRAAAGANF